MEKVTVEQEDFYNQMYRAFQHGREFFSMELGGDMSEDIPDANLPFAEWFNKYYKNEI